MVDGGLVMSQLSPLLAVAGMFTSAHSRGSHREDLMEIMAGYAAVIQLSVLHFFPHPC